MSSTLLVTHVLADHLHVFEYGTDKRYYCFLISIAHCARVTPKAISQTIVRHFHDWSNAILRLSQKEFKADSASSSNRA